MLEVKEKIKKRRKMMKTKVTLILLAALLTCLWTVSPSLAQKKRGHTGGLGEARIEFNVSSANNLAKALGITKEIAEAIVKYREEKGAFKKPEDLLKVPGITPEVFKQINPQVGTEGDLYTVPRPGEQLEEEEDAPLAPSKC
jgi:competence ComEA-like helix-hairpin-helix protein